MELCLSSLPSRQFLMDFREGKSNEQAFIKLVLANPGGGGAATQCLGSLRWPRRAVGAWGGFGKTCFMDSNRREAA